MSEPLIVRLTEPLQYTEIGCNRDGVPVGPVRFHSGDGDTWTLRDGRWELDHAGGLYDNTWRCGTVAR